MLGSKLPMIAAISVAVFASACLAQSMTHDERCQVIEGNGVRVDQCDGTKLLSCRDGRCQCPDPANQVYTYRNEIVQNRSKRSPGKKGSTFKKVAVGAVAGIATYQVAKSAGKAFNNGFSTTPPPPKYNKVFSCYSRVGGECALNYNNWEKIDGSTTTTTTSTTTEGPSSSSASNVTAAADNSTTTPEPSTTTAGPQAAAQVSQRDISKIPRCVQNAVCKFGTPAPSGNSTSASAGFRQSVDFDPRVGVCECAPGYEKNSRDLCAKKSGSGAGKTVTGASMAVIFATLIINKMFA